MAKATIETTMLMPPITANPAQTSVLA